MSVFNTVLRCQDKLIYMIKYGKPRDIDPRLNQI